MLGGGGGGHQGSPGPAAGWGKNFQGGGSYNYFVESATECMKVHNFVGGGGGYEDRRGGGNYG